MTEVVPISKHALMTFQEKIDQCEGILYSRVFQTVCNGHSKFTPCFSLLPFTVLFIICLLWLKHQLRESRECVLFVRCYMSGF